MSFRYLCIVSYDGSNYSGFQRQENANSIQNELEKALKNMTRQVIVIQSAGRTDKGVHAINHAIHFDLDFEIEHLELWIKGINKRLPSDIIFKSIKLVDNSFHSRHNAKARIYEYMIAKKPSDILSQRFEVYVENFNVNLVKDILSKFEGEKDFTGFSKWSPDKTPIRKLYSLKIIETENHYIFEFNGESFLRHMVRTIMGLIIEIATNQKDESIIDEIFLTKNRELAGKTAEAKGLFLKEVIY